MRSVRRNLIAALLVLVWVSSTLAQSRIDCSALSSRILKQTVHYCVYVPSGYDEAAKQSPPRRYPVLYFLHGLGDNERTLFNSGGWTLLDDLRKQNKMGEFLIVAPEGRRSFYVNSADGTVRYSDFFFQEFVPAIEGKYRIRPGRAGRAISGISMGGFGALRFAFARPDFFSAVSAQSAALITQTPAELNAGSRTGSPLLQVLQPVFGNPIDSSHWEQNSPFALAKKNATGIARLAIYFNCGQSDDYGFESGAAKLDELLTAEKIKHEYHSYPGDHSLTYFLSHFAEIMEFHSRAFGLLQH